MTFIAEEPQAPEDDVFNAFFSWINRIVNGAKPWVTVLPWQQGLRIRLGRFIRVLEPGVRIRIPWVDSVFIVNTRLRTLTTARQTITTVDGATVTIAMNVAFRVLNIRKLFETLHAPGETISDLAMSLAARWVAEHTRAEATPQAIGTAVARSLDLEQYGLDYQRCYVSEYAVVRTYRLIGDTSYSGPYISTSQALDAKPSGDE